MEKLYLERPSIERKTEAIEYINEFIQNNSKINGVGGLHKYLDNYEEWLNVVNEKWNREKTELDVPSQTYFLIRKSDNRIVGMIDIRLALTEELKKHGGNIGYSIRPSERRKGYNKINLYLALKVCDEHNVDKVMLDCNKNNEGSSRTIKALGGVLTKEIYDENKDEVLQGYWIDVKKSLEDNKKYEDFIVNNEI